MSDYDFLDSFEDEYRAQHAFRPGLDTLAAGDYDCEITDAALDEINGKPILRMGLKAGGRAVENIYWFERQAVVNGLCADLAALGFDSATWGAAHGKPLRIVLPQAVAKLPGLRFRATKTTKPGKEAGKVFHELHISGRIAGAAPPPPAAVSAPAHVGAPPAGHDEVPF